MSNNFYFLQLFTVLLIKRFARLVFTSFKLNTCNMSLVSGNIAPSDIPWIYPNPNEFDHISATQQSLGGLSSSSENSSSYYDEYPSLPMYPSLESQYPSSGYISGPQDMPLDLEQPTPQELFGLNAFLGDALDDVHTKTTLTNINSPIQQTIEPQPQCFNLTDLSHCYKPQENSSPAPSPVTPSANFYVDDMCWQQVDTFADIEVTAVDPDNLADVYSRIDINSSIHCNLSAPAPCSFDSGLGLPNITSVLPNPGTPSFPQQSQCKTEISNGSTFPPSYPKKTSKQLLLKNL